MSDEPLSVQATETIEVFSWAQAVQFSSLPTSMKTVLFNLCFYVNGLGDISYPSVARQSRDTGLSERTVAGLLRKAEKAGFIERDDSISPGYPPRYELCLPEGICYVSGLLVPEDAFDEWKSQNSRTPPLS